MKEIRNRNTSDQLTCAACPGGPGRSVCAYKQRNKRSMCFKTKIKSHKEKNYEITIKTNIIKKTRSYCYVVYLKENGNICQKDK